MQGRNAPRPKDTYSEIGDPADKEEIFRHSINSGVFRNINNSPLKNKMPPSLQIYKGD